MTPPSARATWVPLPSVAAKRARGSISAGECARPNSGWGLVRWPEWAGLAGRDRGVAEKKALSRKTQEPALTRKSGIVFILFALSLRVNSYSDYLGVWGKRLQRKT